MSPTEEKEESAQKQVPVRPPLTIKELTDVLIKHYGLHEGLYDLTVEFQIGVGSVGPNKEQLLPGAMVGVSRVGLVAVKGAAPSVVDAAQVNPLKRTRRSRS